MELKQKIVEKDKDLDELRSHIESLNSDIYTVNRHLAGIKEDLELKTEQLEDSRETILGLNTEKLNQHQVIRKQEKRIER